jgi:hypothetical protein
LVNAFWRAPNVCGLTGETLRRYAFSLKVWLDFLHAVGASWDQAGRDELAMFKQRRLSPEYNADPLMPNTFVVDRAAIRRFYLWAAERRDVENPVRLRAVGPSFFAGERTALEGTPSAVRRSDVKWLTPEAFRLWRTIGLRGFTGDGVLGALWRGLTEDRDVAFVEGLFGTGLRLGEWTSQVTIELSVMAWRRSPSTRRGCGTTASPQYARRRSTPSWRSPGTHSSGGV